jgi:hypothetical protein
MGVTTAIIGAGTSLYSAYSANERADQMTEQASQSDPWASSGGRALADRQLQLLMTDPEAAMLADPGYLAAMKGATRAMARYGQNSGNMAVAAASTASNWYDNAVRRLSGLAGATQMPAQGTNAAVSGMAQANQQAGQGLASLGYGIRQLENIFGGT